MKNRSIPLLILFVALAVCLGCLSYFGIGEQQILGINHIKLGLDLSGGAYVVYEADVENPTTEQMESALSLIRGRLDRKSYTEAEVAIEGTSRLRVEMPGVEDATQAVAEIGQTAQLYFVDPVGAVIVTGDMVVNAESAYGQTSSTGGQSHYITLSFNDEGRKAFGEATERLIGQQIYILLDEELIQAATVQSAITDGNAIISGSFTAEEAKETAALIRSGALPFQLNVLTMNSIGARLGINALETSIFAGILGTALVLIFMLFVYRMSGFAADWALILYIELTLLALSLFGVTLTLPGIAGIVLSIGMAVDANVIIFERIKEELNNGKTLRASIDAGFSRAFPAILDGNVTTLIAGAILFLLGTGPIKGFAQTLMIGIIISMFTALVITRMIIKAFVGAGFNTPALYGVRSK